MTPKPIDIVVTWPKKKSLEHYLEVLDLVAQDGGKINYRVSSPPSWDFGALEQRLARCYMVHDGAIRGYTDILSVVWRAAGEVQNVDEGGYWPEGWYIVRSPGWQWLNFPVPMKGFRGWRWTDIAEWNPPIAAVRIRRGWFYVANKGQMVITRRGTEDPEVDEVLLCPAPILLGEALEARPDGYWRISVNPRRSST